MEEFQNEKMGAERLLRRKIKRSKKRLQACVEETKEAHKWQELQHLAHLLQNAFHLLKRGMAMIELEDWEQEGKKVTVPLDPALLPQEQLEALFKKSRKLKKRIPHLERRLSECQRGLEALEEGLLELEAIDTEKDLQAFVKRLGVHSNLEPPKKKQQEVKERAFYRTFTSKNGYPILVAKSGPDGDRLTFTVAHGSDIWLHASNVPGSHVVVRIGKKGPPPQEDIQEAALLALHYSKAKVSGGEDVTVTERKYVSKPRGAKPGLVTLSRRTTLYCKRDDVRLREIKSRADSKA